MGMQEPHSTVDAPPDLEGRPRDRGDIWAIGFGVTVAMWTLGYVGRMPLALALADLAPADLPPAGFLALMLGCLVAGGWVAGRYTRRGLRGAVEIGLIANTLNLLILGSLLRESLEGQIVPAAWLWLPGSYALSVALTCAGTLLARKPTPAHRGRNWTELHAWITAAAALVLIAAGGLVTGFRAGMAVPDWPNTFETNMFLFPLKLMTGGVFYEHAHRLLGTLVGLATLVLAIRLTADRARRGPAIAVWIVGAGVAVQGILGGFRVTVDSHVLAVIHGFFAHMVFGGLVAVAVALSSPWRPRLAVEVRQSADADRFLTVLAIVMILVQTLLGTLVRQLNVWLLTHVTVAVLVVVAVSGAGVRAWGLNERVAVLRRYGIALLTLLLLQVVLGLVAIPFRTPDVGTSPTAEVLEASGHQLPVAPLNALLTTAHQSCAALLLGAAVALAMWTWQMLDPVQRRGA